MLRQVTRELAESGGVLWLKVDGSDARVVVPAGMKSETTVTLQGRGEHGHYGGEPGDLLVKLSL